MSLKGLFRTARGGLVLALTVAATVGPLAVGAAAQAPATAQAAAGTQALLTPVAPAPGPLAFDIPLYPWYLRQAVDEKSAFVRVLAAETVALGESGIGGDVQSIVQGALGLAADGDRLSAQMATIGDIEPSFGIKDVSQLLPVEGAVRDTIFGFVVWHESSVSESRETAADLERLVGRVKALGVTAARLAGDLASKTASSKTAVGREQYDPVVNAWAELDQTITQLRDTADQAQEQASALGSLAAGIREQAPPSLDAEWAGVLATTNEAQRLASGIGASLDALIASNAVFADLTNALKSFAASVTALEAAPVEADGLARIPWTLFKDDVDLVAWLDQRVIRDTAGVYPEATKRRIADGLRHVVVADGLLAERAVEYGSTAVAGTADRVEAHYLTIEGYRRGDPQRKRDEATQKAADRMRENMDLQSSLISAREARAALAAGRASQAAGAGSEYQALVHFKNAWLHALNGGDSGLRALAAAGVR
jgi:conjugal transfer/entry exclusion protein